jgi:hypothetical protein
MASSLQLLYAYVVDAVQHSDRSLSEQVHTESYIGEHMDDA